MHTNNALKVLRLALHKISHSHLWVQNCYAEDACGNPTTPRGLGGYKFCAIGAIDRASFDIGAPYDEALGWLAETIGRRDGESAHSAVLAFNDARGRRYKEVTTAFQRAIAAAEAAINQQPKPA